MIKMFLAPVLIAIILACFASFYQFSSTEEKSSFIRGSFKAVIFLLIAIMLLTVFVILF